MRRDSTLLPGIPTCTQAVSLSLSPLSPLASRSSSSSSSSLSHTDTPTVTRSLPENVHVLSWESVHVRSRRGFYYYF